MNDLIKKLLEYSINIQIKPKKTYSDLASLKTVITVLNNLHSSFRNYIKVEFLKHEEFNKIYEKDEKVLDNLIKEMELLIVDSKTGSYQTSVAPNLEDINYSLFDNDVLNWKRDKYNLYKADVLLADFEDLGFVENISRSYSPEERKIIYNPIFDAISDGKDYKINLLGKDREKIIRTLQPPSGIRKTQIIPKLEIMKEITEKNYVAYLRLSTKGDKIDLKKPNIKEIYDIEELKYDTYPFKPEIIRYEHYVFVFKEKITCEVSYSEGLYYILYEPLEINVWGQTREETKDAFCFTFYSLYENFVLEKEENLSPKAQNLKAKIEALLKTVHHETQKNS